MEKKNAIFNKKAFKSSRRKGIIRFGKRAILIAIPALLILVFSIDYISKLPLEGNTENFSYLGNIVLAAKKSINAAYLAITTDSSNPKQSKLPVVQLNIKDERLKELTKSSLHSDNLFQKASFKADGKTYKAHVKFKKSSFNHRGFPNKSWQIELTKDKHNNKQNLFNLNAPHTKNQISNWLGYHMASIMNATEGSGPLVPQAEFIHFNVNEQYEGIRLMLEQPDQNFLRSRNLQPGKIFIGDIASDQVHGSVPPKSLYSDSTAWRVDSPGIDVSSRQIEELINLIKIHQDPYDFYYESSKLVDVDAVLKYMALLELTGSLHIDNRHNNKFYLNPISGKLVPIVWDTIAYSEKNTEKIDLPANNLFRKLLSIPSLREKKDGYLYEAITGKLESARIQKVIKTKAIEIASDVHAFTLKTHTSNIADPEWEQSIEELITTVKIRNDYILKTLSKSDITYNTVNTKTAEGNVFKLAIKVNSNAAFKFKGLSLQLNNDTTGTKVIVVRMGLNDVKQNLKAEFKDLKALSNKGKVDFTFTDTLYSKRKVGKEVIFVPGLYVYEFLTEPNTEITKIAFIRGDNSITKKQVAVKLDQTLNIPTTIQPNSIWWNPEEVTAAKNIKLSGDIDLNEDLIINQFEKLTIEAGTHIKIAPKVSIISEEGQIEFRGSKDRPIIIEAASKKTPWGVIAINGGSFTAKHTVINGGSELHTGAIFYPSSLNIYNGTAQIEDLTLNGGFISSKYSNLSVINSNFINYNGITVKGLNSNSHEENNTLKTLTAAHTESLIKRKALGTEKRTEREFKFTIKTVDEHDGSEIASKLIAALSAKNNALWNAENLVNQSYWVDPEVKDFAFSDIYFDTADLLNHKYAISYRLRTRYKSLKDHDKNISKPQDPSHWPYRLEFQAKTGRKEMGNGFSVVEEARFEFRKESAPFSESKLPPPQPWPLNDYIPWFKTGTYKGIVTTPGQSVYEYLNNLTEKTSFTFEPQLVLITQRHRLHLNIKTPWGTGPNPEQAFIISLDKSDIYDATDYLKYIALKESGLKAKKPARRDYLFEIEVEFERNISDKLDKTIAEANASGDLKEAARLEKIRAAFLADQGHIMTVIKKHFATLHINVTPASASKYVHAIDLL